MTKLISQMFEYHPLSGLSVFANFTRLAFSSYCLYFYVLLCLNSYFQSINLDIFAVYSIGGRTACKHWHRQLIVWFRLFSCKSFACSWCPSLLSLKFILKDNFYQIHVTITSFLRQQDGTYISLTYIKNTRK